LKPSEDASFNRISANIADRHLSCEPDSSPKITVEGAIGRPNKLDRIAPTIARSAAGSSTFQSSKQTFKIYVLIPQTDAQTLFPKPPKSTLAAVGLLQLPAGEAFRNGFSTRVPEFQQGAGRDPSIQHTTAEPGFND
jgi:hypothetical protein